MASVLVFGSHRDVLGYVSNALQTAGYEVLPSLAREDTLRFIAEQHVDVLVLGGPTAHRSADEVIEALKKRHPWAPVIFPISPDDVLAQVERHFLSDMN